jgi:chemotaxis protein MotB
MKRFLTTSVVFSVGLLLLAGCLVPKKKMLEQSHRADVAEADNKKLRGQVSNLQSENAKFAAANKAQDASIKALNKKVAELNDEIAALQARVNSQSDSLDAYRENVANLSGKVKHLSGKVSELGSENENANNQLNQTKAQIAEQKRKLEQLQALIDQQQKATESLRKKIADALAGFNSSELTVTRKNGKVYISMQESLLFPSGSAVVNPKGKEALSKVATVLKQSKDINIEIEGHTDSIPIHNKVFADNWQLSTARATSIAHVLIDEYTVSPARLTASGRSEYDPATSNATPEGRAKNRRTEIILEPKLDELLEMMDGGKKK